jgi:hypothetical protein
MYTALFLFMYLLTFVRVFDHRNTLIHYEIKLLEFS